MISEPWWMKAWIYLAITLIVVGFGIQIACLFLSNNQKQHPVWIDSNGGITTTDWKDQPEWFIIDHEKNTVTRYCYGKKC